MSTQTPHKTDCKMAFGRKDATCPRCQELLNGAETRKGWGWQTKQDNARRSREIEYHYAHHEEVCDYAKRNVPCVAFDW